MAKRIYAWINPYVDYGKKPHLEAYSNTYTLYETYEFKKDEDNQWKGFIMNGSIKKGLQTPQSVL